LKKPNPIIVVHLFPEILDKLLDLLSGLSPQDWQKPTACSSWSVKDVALHLLGGDIGILSRGRDGFAPPAEPARDWGELVTHVHNLNQTWVGAARRISPRLLYDLLEFTGPQVYQHFHSLDPYALGGPVGWVSPEPAPVWLDIAREYTERWHHQQHIRDAVGKPGLKKPRFMAPALDTFVRALPRTCEKVMAGEGTVVALTIVGESGGRWFVLREEGAWLLYLGAPQGSDAEVLLPEDVAWRSFTRGLSEGEAASKVRIVGDRALGQKILEMASIIA
jgi:uncharacterized protein (TIGR03083 family)